MHHMINLIAEGIHDWANETFPRRTDSSMFLKLYAEIAEMIESDGDGSEIADVMIMLMDYAVRKNVDLAKAIHDKMEINRQRVWRVNDLGVMQHVEIQPLGIPAIPGNGSSDPVASSKTLAHDRDNAYANSCRAHGECRAARLVDCPNFAGGLLSIKHSPNRCTLARPGRNIHGGHSDAHETGDREGDRGQRGIGGPSGDLFSGS